MVPFPGRIRDFLFFEASRLAPKPTHPRIQRVWGPFSPEGKKLHCATDHSPPSCAKVRNEYNLWLHSPICLYKTQKDNFTVEVFALLEG